jgi:outer membrane protein TolC
MSKNCRMIVLALLLMTGCSGPQKSLQLRSTAVPEINSRSTTVTQRPLSEKKSDDTSVIPASAEVAAGPEDAASNSSEEIVAETAAGAAAVDSGSASATAESADVPVRLISSPQSQSSVDTQTSESSVEAMPPEVESAAPPNSADAELHAVQFEEVIGSVYQSYPLLQGALLNRNIALGQQVGASGAFDTKIKGASENGPQGFYQTYRQSLGVIQPTYWGGELFAGYRVGRGDFQPWYLERQTNDGGEFKAGVQVPLARNREIDARRAELWKAGFGRNLAEPDIQAQLIGFVQEASYSYWDWVAAGENHRIVSRILLLADDRTQRIDAQVKAGLVDPPELTDNLRLVAIRRAKVADTRRKLEQTAAKLSVYFRDTRGEPLIPTEVQLPGYPEPEPIHDDVESDVQRAIANRPELRMLSIVQQQLRIDYSEAVNQLQPELNAVLIGSQDVGEPTSSKRDKSPYEGEASVFLDVPVQRRKARGKMTELQAKISQVAAKRRITADKIGVDVRMAHAALRSAFEQVEQSRESLRHAEDLAARERTNQEKGISDLLKVALREQYAVESAEKNVDALKLYFESQADYRAAMALDRIDR